MPWWNLYKTENDEDLATIARVDSELEALNQARRAKKEQEAADLEDLGLGDEADQLRDGLDEWDRLHAINLKTQNDALKETSADAFNTELDTRAGSFRNGVAATIGTTLGTFFKLLPWWLWLAIAAAAFFYLGGARYLPTRKRA